ncbi:tRNA (adenosine(37)-N6)-threonylcarbamoyltransferase complex ATPase subunit type 1 TsaE [Nonlabens spongiae]|uniref:tRNA threonylcarbamoyladenosine biosynthesis protein TsaE n=1 Tax=Nonlabens spongiae TaxID=331648 RepID=A0A1W6MIZ2_9FLAO|nr:tRNA (adenosine(37)-N6)-threonylcarbamoyltransferase complex ATPase subunit type 1 TsaE [Nonlabens spongiae]ARN77588.1 tRNA (adenosine(37)-N6)-threonylcarbamoyltransferase complex ATPase subunit type 1 TsaE [Nonlabens spongiae]
MEMNYALSEIDNVSETILKNRVHDTIIFKAPIGAGKTTLIKTLCKELGVEGEISSPTFSLVNEHQGKSEDILHFDLYRMESKEELYGIGMEDYLDRKALKLIEWPELAMDLLDQHHVVEIEIVDADRRRLVFA